MKKLALLMLLGVAACELEISTEPPQTANIDEIRTYFDGNNAFVYTVDALFTTAAAAIVRVDEPFEVLETGIGEGDWFSTDVAFQSDSRFIYIIDRINANITVVDPLDKGKELKQVSVGAGTNPKSVVRINGKLYISRYDSPELLVLDAETYENISTVAFNEYEDVDGMAEMGLAVTAAGRVWVILERYERQPDFWLPSTQPVDGSYLVSINPENDLIEKEIKLLGLTPYQMLKVDPLNGDLLIVSNAMWPQAGIEAVDPILGKSKGWVVEPSEFAEGIFFAEATTTNVYVVSGEGAHNGSPDWDWDYAVLWAIDRATGEKTEVFRTSEGFKGIACLEVTPGTTKDPNKRYLLTCAGPSVKVTTPGLRVFDTATHKQLTQKPLDTGLPPFGLTFFAQPITEVVSVPATTATE